LCSLLGSDVVFCLVFDGLEVLSVLSGIVLPQGLVLGNATLPGPKAQTPGKDRWPCLGKNRCQILFQKESMVLSPAWAEGQSTREEPPRKHHWLCLGKNRGWILPWKGSTGFSPA